MKGLTVVFDLDGTLVDTAPDLAAATSHVLEQLSLAPVNAQEILPFVGRGALAMIDNAVRAHGSKLTEHERDRLFQDFMVYYSAHIADHSRPYNGTVAALNRLLECGATLAVCTNKLEGHARQVLTALGLTNYFAAITGGDSFDFRKPHPKHLTGTITMAGGIAARAIMVGDSETDILAAQAARVPVIAVSFGYSDVPVATLSPDAVIDRYEDLADAIHSLTRMPCQ